MSFPTLTATPSVSNWEEGLAFDPTLRSQKEGGYVATRPRFTRTPLRWKVAYTQGNCLSNADKLLLVAHEASVNVGSASFDWTNPMDSVTYTVRYINGPMKFKPLAAKVLWEVSFELEQV